MTADRECRCLDAEDVNDTYLHALDTGVPADWDAAWQTAELRTRALEQCPSHTQAEVDAAFVEMNRIMAEACEVPFTDAAESYKRGLHQQFEYWSERVAGLRAGVPDDHGRTLAEAEETLADIRADLIAAYEREGHKGDDAQTMLYLNRPS